MVVIGKEPIDFVVVQFANGVDIEDCQEAELSKEERGRLSVAIPRMIALICSIASSISGGKTSVSVYQLSWHWLWSNLPTDINNGSPSSLSIYFTA
jgi:hypothetical protein